MIKKQAIKTIYEGIKPSYPNINEAFIPEYDALNNGFGCIITLSHGVISIFSQRFTKSECNYSIVKKEFFAMKRD